MSEDQTNYGHARPHEPLSGPDLQRILDATFELLRDTGVGFEHEDRTMDLFSDAGCDISAEGIVKFSTDLVEESLGSVAKSVKLWDRSGTESIEISHRTTHFFPGMTCIKVYDLETGEARESTREDLCMISRVADFLPEIDGVCVSCKNVGRSNIQGEIDEFMAIVESTTKPLEYLCEQTVSFRAAIEMAAAVRGGHSALAEKPYFLHIVTPLPLYYGKTHSEQIILAAEHGIPVNCGTIAIGGASAPITMAGCMVHSLATDFAGMVLAQRVRKGAFSVGSSDAAFMEPATGGIGSAAQTSMADAAMCQIRRHLELPSLTGHGGCSVARRFNQDAVWELATNMAHMAYSRPATCDYLGSLDEGITYSLHALLLCNELAAMMRCLYLGIGTDDEQLALELTAKEGSRGNYLAQRHTAKFCRIDRWETKYLGPHVPLSSGLDPDKDLVERIDDDLRMILAEHRPEELPGALRTELGEIMERYADAVPED